MTVKVQRNDPCLCGSGKKYKKCCLNNNTGTLKSFRFRLFGAIAVLTIFIASFIYATAKNQEPPSQSAKIPDIKRTQQAQRFPVNKVQLTKEEIIKYELPTLNLIAAQGLPGAENLDIRSCLTILNKWADRVSFETQKYFPRFYENPNDYNNSEAYFRMLVLITVLEQDLNIRYNPDLMSKPILKDMRSTKFFRNSQDIFLHGLINNKLGTCASLPVLTASVGRILGYPLKLVPAKAHLFVRWDDGKETFNIESGGRGMKCFPDEYYRKWPFPISDREMQSGFYLKSLTPIEEYASFMELRGICLFEHNKLAEAFNAMSHAGSLMPNHPHITEYLGKIMKKEEMIN